MLTIKDLVDKYQVSRFTINSWIKEGMPSYKIGRLVRFEAAEVEAWVKRKQNKK